MSLYLNELFISGNSFPSRNCDRDFRQDQEKAPAVSIGKPEGLSAAVQRRRQIERAACVLYNEHNWESNLPDKTPLAQQ